MVYIIITIVVYVISLIFYKIARERKFTRLRNKYSVHIDNPNPVIRKRHYKGTNYHNNEAHIIDSELELRNMQNLEHNERMLEYMMWHNMNK